MTSAVDLPDWIASVAGPTQIIFNGFINSANVFPVAQYQSLLIVLGNLDNTTPMVATYQFIDSTGFVVDQGILSADSITTEGAWTLPVVAPQFKLISGVGAALIARVTGLPTRLGKRMMDDYTPARDFFVSIPNGTPSNTNTQIPGSTLSSFANHPDQSSYNGQVLYAFTLTALGGGTKFTLRARIRLPNGSTGLLDVLSSSTVGAISVIGGHPNGYVSWFVNNTGALTSAVGVGMSIFPAEAA